MPPHPVAAAPAFRSENFPNQAVRAALSGTQFYARAKRNLDIVDRVAATTRIVDISARVAVTCCRCEPAKSTLRPRNNRYTPRGTNEAISRLPGIFRRAFSPLQAVVAFSAGDGDGAAAGDSNRTRHGECDARFWSRNGRSRFSPPRRAEYLLAGFG